MQILSSFTKLSRPVKAAVTAATIILLYAGLGFLVAPPILKSILIANITEQVGRNVSVNKIKVNPFELSVALQGFEMSESNGGRFVAFEELYVNFQLSSIYHRALTFAEVHLIGPDGRVKVLSDGTMNFSDILGPLNSAKPHPAGEGEATELPPVYISTLQIDRGRLDFSDLSKSTPFEITISPIQFSLNNFSTLKDRESPYALTATLGEGAILRWEGDVSVNPLSSQGRFELSGIKLRTFFQYVQDLVKFEVDGGSIDLAGQYKADLSGERVQAELIDAEVELDGFELSEKGGDVKLISVPSLIVKGVNADLNEKKVLVASVHSNDGWFALWRTRDGEINYQKLIPAELLGDKPTETDEQPGDEVQTWDIRVNEMGFENYGARLENRAFAKPMVVTLDTINAKLKSLSNQKNSEAEFNLVLSIDKKGKVEIEGIASADPVSADLRLRASNTPMRSLQTYLEALTQAQLASGQVNWNVRLQYNRFGKDGPLLRLEGDTSIDDIQLVERSSGEDLARCESLAANGLAFDVEPSKLSVSNIVIKKPYAKVIVFPDATVNLANAFAAKETEGSEEALLIFEKVVRAFELQLKQNMPINIDNVRIESGSADFADLSIKPNFAADIRDLNGTVKGLSSKPKTRAEVLLEGKANRHAPVKITGQMNPLSPDVYIDLGLSFKNMELTRLSPYSGRFAGFLIKKGKMSVDLKYKVSGNRLNGENQIVLNQLTLGERVNSPDATSLPVGLAIALLKDSEGNIELDVPVSGDLKDPQFDIGGVVAKAVGQVITKIVTSPFALLGSLVGGGSSEELDFIDFEFGSAALSVTEIEKLDTLSKALNERPALRLEIEGAADKQSDGVALAEAELLNQLKLARVEELQEAGKTVPVSVDDLTLSYEDYGRLITQKYIDRFGKDPKALFAGESKSSAEESTAINPEVIIAAAKAKLIETAPVDESGLKRLAQERAMQIKNHLVLNGKVPEDRLDIRGAEITDGTDGESIRIHLTLSGA